MRIPNDKTAIEHIAYVFYDAGWEETAADLVREYGVSPDIAEEVCAALEKLTREAD